jgi:hypothetical protein
MRRALLIARAIAFVAIAVYFVAAPAARQVFGVRSHAFRTWVMFSGANLDVCEVRYHEAGREASIDRYEVLGHTPWYSASGNVRKIKSVDDVWRQGRQLCGRLAPGTDLRADARCATRTGWKPVMRGDVNLCAGRRAAGQPGTPSVDD